MHPEVKPEVVAPPKKLLDRVRDAVRVRHYSIHTEEAYVHWIRRFIVFNQKRHPAEMGVVEVRAFLEDLVLEKNVAASTQNQAFNALLFLYEKVLETKLGDIRGVARSKRPQRLPSVLSKNEVQQLLTTMSGTPQLIAKVLYGTGLRLMETMRLRVKDIDFERNQIVVREGKGNKDRVTMLPSSLKSRLEEHLQGVKRLHEQDVAAGVAGVHLPNALERKYPRAGHEWAWQYVFPAKSLSIDPRTGQVSVLTIDTSVDIL